MLLGWMPCGSSKGSQAFPTPSELEGPASLWDTLINELKAFPDYPIRPLPCTQGLTLHPLSFVLSGRRHFRPARNAAALLPCAEPKQAGAEGLHPEPNGQKRHGKAAPTGENTRLRVRTCLPCALKGWVMSSDPNKEVFVFWPPKLELTGRRAR